MKKRPRTVECRDEGERELILARLRRSGTPVFAANQTREGRPVLRLPAERGGQALRSPWDGTVTF